jgi:hypothetical protein
MRQQPNQCLLVQRVTERIQQTPVQRRQRQQLGSLRMPRRMLLLQQQRQTPQPQVLSLMVLLPLALVPQHPL